MGPAPTRWVSSLLLMRAVVVLLAALFVAVAPAPARAQEATEDVPSTAIASQDGWWYRAQGPQQGEPANPLRGAIGPLLPAPSTVPGNAIAVGAVGGDADKVAAVGIVLDAPIDALADTLKLTLKESTANGANANAASAAIIACPITGFWAGAKNGNWADRPACDDTQAVRGTRAADGTWTWDLALLASSWIDGTLDQNGVLLVEAVDAPMGFQVSFDDIASGRVGLEFTTFGGGFSGASDFAFDDTFADDQTFGETTFEDVQPTFDEPAFTTTDDLSVPSTIAPASTGAGAARSPQVAQPVAALGGDPSRAGKLFGNWPLGVALLLVALIGGALGLSVLLGPSTATAPATIRRTGGGVSRALAARASNRD